ncbi:MAG: hypothetical protein K2H06_01185, partial [Anaeroplasmataceae bacterium]|nr:hypothetical protein [Anaeroplasmataceae bacterium]
TYDEDGNVVPTYIQNDDIQIIYSFNSDFSNPSNTPLPVKKLGHTLVWAKIMDKTGNIATATTYTMVYLYEDKGGEDDPDKPIDGPTDAENDPEHIKFEKFKTYNAQEYEWPVWLGSKDNRTFETTFYTLEYWKQCQADGVELDPAQAIARPIDIGEYVFDYRVGKDTTDPEDFDRRYLQAFRVKPKYVSAIWENLMVYIPDGDVQLENPTLPKATYIDAEGHLNNLDVGPLPGYVSEGVYTVNATIPNNEKGNYILKNPGNIFEITSDKDKKPKPNDAELRDDITFKKDKEYDTKPYPTPEFTGHNADNRPATVKYYDWDYYQEHYPDLDPSKAIDAPTDTGKYVFVMDIPADPDDPDGHPAEQVHQYFTVSPHPVEVTWSDLEHNFDGTMKYAHAEFKGTGDESDLDFVCEVVPGYDYVGDSLPVLAKTPNKNYTITNPNANMRIIGTVVDDIVIAPGQEFKYDDPIILKDTAADPNYYISKDDYDKDNTIVPTSDWSKVFLVDNDGNIYKWDPEYGEWVDADVPYKMHIDVNRDAGTHKVTMELKDKTQYSWKNHGTNDIEETYEIEPIKLPDEEYDVEYAYQEIWEYMDGKEIKPPVQVTLVERAKPTHRIELKSEEYTLAYENNTEPTDEALIKVQGAGNYSFYKELYFSIVENIQLLEILDGSKIAWIKAFIDDDGQAEFIGEDKDEEPVEHLVPSESGPTGGGLYLGRLHQETFIKDVLAQFVNYAEHPEWFIVKRIAVTDEEFARPDIDKHNYIPIDAADYETQYFGNSYMICLEIDGTVVDFVYAILHGDINGDGYVNAGDVGEAGRFVAQQKQFNDVPLMTYFAGVTKKENYFYNGSTLSNLGPYIANSSVETDFNLFGDTYRYLYEEE